MKIILKSSKWSIEFSATISQISRKFRKVSKIWTLKTTEKIHAKKKSKVGQKDTKAWLNDYTSDTCE